MLLQGTFNPGNELSMNFHEFGLSPYLGRTPKSLPKGTRVTKMERNELGEGLMGAGHCFREDIHSESMH